MNTCMVYEYLFGVWIHVWCMNNFLVYLYLFRVWIPVWCMNTCLVYEYLFGVWMPVWCMNNCLVYAYHFGVRIPVWCMNNSIEWLCCIYSYCHSSPGTTRLKINFRNRLQACQNLPLIKDILNISSQTLPLRDLTVYFLYFPEKF